MQDNDKSLADKMIEAGDKMQGVGSGMGKAGGVLTVMITIPLLLAILFGVPGLLIGIVLAVLYMARRNK